MSSTNRMLIFASIEGLKLLASSPQWHFDGTFKSCPKLFTQIFTIHAWLLDEMHDCVYVYMTERNYTAYCELLLNIKIYCEQKNILLQPEVIFELFTCLYIFLLIVLYLNRKWSAILKLLHNRLLNFIFPPSSYKAAFSISINVLASNTKKR